MTSEEFKIFIKNSDALCRQRNGMTLGQIYMKVIHETHPKIYNQIMDTELNVYLHRENIPLLMNYLLD